MITKPGKHAKELNPYWKDGGTGLPEDQPQKAKKCEPSRPTGVAGDGGVGWMRKAYQRCVETAKEEGLTLEQVAAERYGVSLCLHVADNPSILPLDSLTDRLQLYVQSI